jgi:predicted dithiol-disulfide oxidoreductase (DUF899 family)
MSLPEIVSRDQWLAARKDLLRREKELTRERDALNADRRRLPMVRVDKKYLFEGPDGTVSLTELFAGSHQLVVQHVMFDPSWEVACPSCSADLDESTPALLAHLKARDTEFVRVSRAPYAKIAANREARGWTFPWFSSFESDFNYDYDVTLDQSVAPVTFNFRDLDENVAAGLGWLADGGSSEQPGFSCFLRDGDDVFHTYSTYGRGTENAVPGAYALLDITPLGRQEDWEEPKGRGFKVVGADPSFRSSSV